MPRPVACGKLSCMQSTDRNELVQRACRQIEASDSSPDLTTLARTAGLSPWHFQRVFKAAVGVSPKRYAIELRRRRLDAALRSSSTVTDAIYDAGYAGSSGAYRDSQQLGMVPGRLRDGGSSELIRFAPASTSLGKILVAATARGVCMVEFGALKSLTEELRRRFPKARVERADESLSQWVSQVVAAIDGSQPGRQLPLDIRGTAFQIRVWQALTRLPRGDTVSYGELARRIRAPNSTRAVAQACATNGIAVVVPCHRVIAKDGNLAGYKWGLERKRKLLQREGALPQADRRG
jgi:AraC family transcriptional regulator, regulatory protein of adaptative response / methylated-DNA-[protein]-cysteine methyltransferase